ncbi:MAG: uracil-DNA glycosylase [Candidatus Krumholzibacteria bacterium]|nr:uracil-DNA glycosylase [Candidatus Krumholzibacteria bacterium]
MKTTRGDFPQEINLHLISYLEMLQRKGIKSIYLTPPGAVHEATAEQKQLSGDQERSVAKETMGGIVEKLSEVDAKVSVCEDCGLHRGRTNTVFGTGNPGTKVMFIGEGPGRDEDIQGKPFVGRSGQLLTKMLGAIDLSREDVYITNIVKCRPPDNRDPQEEEVRCCEKYLIAQIDLIRPRIICALGRVAAHWLLDTKDSLAALRNRENFYRGTQVLVTYHPAALLRNPGLKRGAWEDFKQLTAIISE